MGRGPGGRTNGGPLSGPRGTRGIRGIRGTSR